MQTLTLIDKVARDLEKDENSIRIKKLIYYVCRRQWENNQAVMDGIRLQDLMQELQTQNSDYEQLTTALRDAIKTISKKTEYSLIAKIILNKMKALYTAEGEDNAADEGSGELGPQYNLFDLRLEVMRQANPLRTKILIFSVLYHQIGFNDQGLAIVKTHGLDDLLKSLFLRLKTHADLESKVRSTTSFLGDPDQMEQIAGVIIQALRPWYFQRQQEAAERQAQQQAQPEWGEPDQPVARTGVPNYWTNPNLNARTTTPPLPVEEMVGTDDALSWLDQINFPPSPSADPPPPTFAAPVAPVEPPQKTHTPQLTTIEEVPVPIAAVPAAVSPPVSPAPSPKPSSPAQPFRDPAVVELLLQRPELHAEVKRQINKSLLDVMSSIENILSDLGNTLDEQLMETEEDQEKALLLKYQALRDFIAEAEGTPSKFLEVLNKLETAERQLFGM